MSQPLSIIHAIAKLDGYGQTNQLRVLVDHQLAEGHRVKVFALAAESGVLKAWQGQGIVCRSFDRRWQFDPFTAWRLRQELRCSNYDLLHVWDSTAHRYCSAVCSATAPPILSRRIAPGIIATLPSSCSREQFLSEQSLPADAQLIAIAGQLTREKQIAEAIWSYELVRTLNPKAHLLVIGEGPERPNLERFSRLASESDAIRFLGYRSDLPELLPLVDIYWHLGETPLAGLEAMALGIPVVASENASNCEIIEEEQTGFLVPWDKRAIWARHTLRLLEDQGFAVKLGRAGAKRIAKHFSAAAMTRAYDRHYEEILAMAATPR